MGTQARHEYLKRIRSRYRKASGKEKKQILDEFYFALRGEVDRKVALIQDMASVTSNMSQ